jgi:hypothetical protein
MRRAVLGSVGGTHLRAPIHFSANPHYVLMMSGKAGIRKSLGYRRGARRVETLFCACA